MTSVEQVIQQNIVHKYDNMYNHKIPMDVVLLVRLDGKGFSKLTSQLKPKKTKENDSVKTVHKAFDTSFSMAMLDTANDLMQEFPEIVTAYTHSDEITVIIAPLTDTNNELKLRRADCGVLDILSLSNTVSVRFTLNLARHVTQNKDQYTDDVFKRYTDIFGGTYTGGYFDARILEFPPDKLNDIVKHQRWRSMYDSYRNAIHQYARYLFSTSQLLNKNNDTVLKMMRDKGFDFDSDAPMSIKYGTYLKRILTNNKVTIEPRSLIIHDQQFPPTIFLLEYWGPIIHQESSRCKLTKIDGDKYGDDIKKYESQYDATVNDDAVIVISMHNNFCELTDQLCSMVMVDSARDLIDEFPEIVTVYTHLGDVHAILNVVSVDSMERKVRMNGGRVLKLVSLISSAMSVNFTLNLMRRTQDIRDKQMFRNIRFTTRILEVPLDDFDDIINYLRVLSIRNNTPGVYLKKMLIEKNAINKNTGKEENCIRTIIDARMFVINGQRCLRELLLAKYWNGYVQQTVTGRNQVAKTITYTNYPEIEFTQF